MSRTHTYGSRHTSTVQSRRRWPSAERMLCIHLRLKLERASRVVRCFPFSKSPKTFKLSATLTNIDYTKSREYLSARNKTCGVFAQFVAPNPAPERKASDTTGAASRRAKEEIA